MFTLFPSSLCQLWIMPSHLWRSRDDVWPRNRLHHWREFLWSARRYSGCLARLIKFSGEYRAYFVYGHSAARYWLRTLLPTKAHFLRCLVKCVVLLCNVSRPDNRAIIIARFAMCIFLGISHDSIVRSIWNDLDYVSFPLASRIFAYLCQRKSDTALRIIVRLE